MSAKKSLNTFDDSLLDQYPDLKEALKSSDRDSDLKQILNPRSEKLPAGSLNTKVIISDGEIVERIYMTPNGEIISLFTQPSNIFLDQAA